METDDMTGGEDLGAMETAPLTTDTPLEADMLNGSFIKVS